MQNLRALLVVGAVAAIGATRARRPYGGRNAVPTPLARRILSTLKNMPDPEQAVRATHFVVSLLPNFRDNAYQLGLPGLCQAVDGMVADLASLLPGATINDYRDLTVTDVTNNSLSDDGSINLDVQWDGAPYTTWIMTQVARLVKAAQRGAAYENEEKMTTSKALSLLRQWKGQFSHIRDWITSPNPERWTNGVQLNSLSWNQANEAANRFHDAIQKEGDEAKIREARRRGTYFDCPDGVARQPSQIVYTFNNGWRVHKLTSAKALLEEGNLNPDNGRGCLRHCIGNPGGSYVRDVERGSGEAYSFRSPEGHPIVTLYFNGAGERRQMDQVKGFGNRIPGVRDSGGAAEGFFRALPRNEEGLPTSGEPSMKKYFKSVDDMLNSEVDMIEEFMNHLGARWTSDSSGLRARDERRQKARTPSGSSARRR
jgi:hypothetical protein